MNSDNVENAELLFHVSDSLSFPHNYLYPHLSALLYYRNQELYVWFVSVSLVQTLHVWKVCTGLMESKCENVIWFLVRRMEKPSPHLQEPFHLDPALKCFTREAKTQSGQVTSEHIAVRPPVRTVQSGCLYPLVGIRFALRDIPSLRRPCKANDTKTRKCIRSLLNF